eukprot:CAMPEP_0118688982 /NCGR_PEP_ID=MMETSP0800-20121206/9221_1 /TAXON_ID=210618 ORGANISM="Striatella unipunctata, Strain CCMP2910" /NCGR_SAMPLE_ID=MMETSP0800 /ASSEMBLY_ACC=CAM_ASM_000638 /LENGTH=518 /DNA_ID=CAMNT_0006586299 /DNA_START=80 /DNA_END=1636 /DNA_ORIENTATION=+
MMSCAIIKCLVLSKVVTSLSPLTIRGNQFFDLVTRKHVAIRGIDYFPRPNSGRLNRNSQDLFTEAYRRVWERDLVYLRELGVNAIRLYAVEPAKSVANSKDSTPEQIRLSSHDGFMNAMNEAGIYVMVEVASDCPTCAVTRDKAPTCYPNELKERGMMVIREFSRYNNTLAFSTGNEVNHFAPPHRPEWNGPCQKKFLADMRKFMKEISSGNEAVLNAPHSDAHRRIPIGLIVADSDREVNAAYYNCEEGDETSAEWYGINSYVFCDGANRDYNGATGLKNLQQFFENLNLKVPVVMTEFGCLSRTFPTMDGYEGQRSFLQAQYLFTEPEMQSQFAGAFAFEFSTEYVNAAPSSPYPFKKLGGQNYGVGYFSPENCDDITISCVFNPLPCFDNLKRAYEYNANLNTPIFVPDEGRNGTVPSCPSQFPPIDTFSWPSDRGGDSLTVLAIVFLLVVTWVLLLTWWKFAQERSLHDNPRGSMNTNEELSYLLDKHPTKRPTEDYSATVSTSSSATSINTHL